MVILRKRKHNYKEILIEKIKAGELKLKYQRKRASVFDLRAKKKAKYRATALFDELKIIEEKL